MINRAETALAPWGGRVVRLISHRENAVFEVRLENDRRAALRLHRPGYNGRAEISSELWWINALAARGFPVPVPLATLQGQNMIDVGDGLLATVLTWVDGQPIGAAGVPLAGNSTQLYHELGSLLAEFHTESDKLNLPAHFQRRSWDCDGLLGEAPLWGRFWENPVLDNKAHAVVLRARMRAIEFLERYRETADFGLIHADALRENVFRQGPGLCLIDFDDSGFGFRMYDLAVALSQSVEDENYTALRQSLLAGYELRRPLSQSDIAAFPVFAMLRALASLGWAGPRIPPQSADMKRYARRAVHLAEAFLS